MKSSWFALLLVVTVLSVPAAAQVTTFLEPGTAATQDFSFFASTIGTVASATDQVHTGSRSLKMSTGAGTASASGNTPTSVAADAGTQVSAWFRFDGLPTSIASLVVIQDNTASSVCSLSLNTNGTLRAAPTGATAVNGTTVLSVNTWYRISLSYYITNTTTYQMKVYLNGGLEATANAGTLTRTGSSQVRFQVAGNFGANKNGWFSDMYVATGGASSASQPDTGDIRVTYKRPFANGTTNGFTGTGAGSGYGSGNAVYVNELPLSTASFVSVVAAGVTTEEYNIESSTVGDVSLSGQTIVDYMGWLYAKALLSETASMVLNNVTLNVALTSTTTMFTAAAGSTTFPAGSGTDIGIITSSLATTVTLYEAGVLVAFTASSGYRSLLGVGRDGDAR